MLEIEHLNAFYGDSHILQDISFSVPNGARVALLGRNGAGKTTLLNSIMNAGPRVSGAIKWDGKELGTLPTFRRARMGIVLVPEDRRIFSHISVAENIELARYSTDASRPAVPVADVLARFPAIEALSGRGGGQLSGGQQQIVAVARAMAAHPRLMLLDEPTEGLAPVIVEHMAEDVIRSCDASDASLILCEQNVWFARKCTEYVYIIDSGAIAFRGSWDEFDADIETNRRYLSV